MLMLDKSLLISNETTKQDSSTREDFLFHSNSYKKRNPDHPEDALQRQVKVVSHSYQPIVG